MEKPRAWRVVGLWRVWDDLPGAPVPTERPPEALLERVAGVFDHPPSIAETRTAMAAADTQMRDAFEAREAVAYVVIEGDARWTRAMNEGGWLPEGVRRHPQGGKHLHALLGYGLEPSAGQRIWIHAEAEREPAENVVARLRRIGDDLGLPPVGIDCGLPIHETRRTVAPARRRRTDRDRGALGD